MKNFLLIDIGNTRIKWAYCGIEKADAWGDWLAQGVGLTIEIADIMHTWEIGKECEVWISNVAGAQIEEMLTAYFVGKLPENAVHWVRSSAHLGGVSNGYRVPESLGVDRLLAMIGARVLYPEKSFLLAACGTATTIDWVDGQGHFNGGVILPGIKLMVSSLAQGAAQLPYSSLAHVQSQIFATETSAGIIEGCVVAQVAAISFVWEKANAQICVLTGGGADFLGRSLPVAHEIHENLVLRGLQKIMFDSL